MAVKTPSTLKTISIFLKTAVEHDNRDPVVAYYCRLYAVQKGMEIDRKSVEGKTFLMGLMDQLDVAKKSMLDNESITSETVGQAHLEEYALKLFSHADRLDRASNFGPPTIKSFYSAGILLDVLSVFGEVGEDIEKCRKYAKWKAIYINQCLKNGETPHAGPLDDENAAEAPNMSMFDDRGAFGGGQPPVPMPRNTPQMPPPAGPSHTNYPPPPNTTNQVPPPSYPPPAAAPPSNSATEGANNLTQDDYTRAEKLCKFTISALQYQDVNTAISNLHKCLSLLTTGKE